MAADAINLDEVVAIGYGIAKKSDLTGAVASIKSEHLTNSKVGTVTTALQGLAAGVQVTTGSVKPGGDASVVIRGVGSLRSTVFLYKVVCRIYHPVILNLSRF